MNENFLIGDGVIIEPQTPYRSVLSQRSDNVELLRSKAIGIAVKNAEQKPKHSIVQTSSLMTRELLEDFCQENLLFKELCNSIALLKKLIDIQLLASIQDVPPKCLDDWLCDWTTLGKRINRVTAIQLISNLPASLRVIKLDNRSDLDDEKALEKRRFAVLLYRLSGSWLWAWEEDFRIPSHLKSYYEPFEPLAFLSEKRRLLIRGLFEKEKVNETLFPNVAFAWLLSEAAFCRRLFQNNLPKHKRYQSWKAYIEQLSNLDDPNLDDHLKWKQLKGLPEIIPSIDLIFEKLGREEVKQNDDFARKYFDPYIEALKQCECKDAQRQSYSSTSI